MNGYPKTQVDALVAELARVLGALLAAEPAIGNVNEFRVPTWTLRLDWSGAWQGQLFLGFDAAGARALSARVMGLAEAPPDTAVADLVLELCNQAAGALSQLPDARGAAIAVREAHGSLPGGAISSSYVLTIGDLRVSVACWGQLEADTPSSRPPLPAEVDPAPSTPPNLDVILDLELPLTVRFGHTDVALYTLTRLGPGSIVDLGRSPDDPVEVLVYGKVIARGEVVVVAGNYGVRITEVAGAAERVEQIER